MTTLYINTASGGGDGTGPGTGTGSNNAYASWADFEAAREATLTEAMIVNCDGAGGVDSSTIAISAFVTTATNTLTVQQNSGGTAYEVQSTAAHSTNEDYVEFKDITISTTAAGRIIAMSSNPPVGNQTTFNNVLFKCSATSSGNEALDFPRTNLNIDFINCRYEGGARVADLRNVASCNINYCSFVLHADQFGLLAGATTDVKNSFIGKAGGANTSNGDFWSGGSPTGSNNASSDTTAITNFGAGSVDSVVINDVLTGTTPGSVNFQLVAGTNALVEAGTVISTTVDYEGDTRDVTSPDIGADERVSAGGGATPKGALNKIFTGPFGGPI